MRRFSRLLAVGSAALAFAGVSNAQFGAPQPGTGTFGPLVIQGANSPLYDHHWHSTAGSPSLLWGADFLWEFFNGNPNPAGPGDAIRICYGVDVTQGGRNWTGPGATTPGPFSAMVAVPGGGATENTWFRWVQAFGPADAAVDIGLISMQGGTTSARGSDNCFSPFLKGFSHATDSGGSRLAAVALGGLFGPTSVAPLPIFWEFTFTWGPTPAVIPNKIGDDTADPGITIAMMVFPPINTTGVPAPLLSNVIYEVQAPVNAAGNGTDDQYYLSSTVEFTGINGFDTFSSLGFIGTGGTSNGNGNSAHDLFGTHAGVNNSVAGSRILTSSPAGAFVSELPGILTPANQAVTPPVFRDGRIEFVGQLAFATPKLWAYHNFQANPLGMPTSFGALGPGHTPPSPFGNPLGGAMVPPAAEGLDGNNGYLLFTGSGGTDWRITSAPLSRVDIIAIDHDTGSEVDFNIYNKVGNYVTTSPTTATFTPFGPYAAAPAGFDTGLGTGGLYAGLFSCKVVSIAVFNWTLLVPFFAIHPQYPGSWGFTVVLGFGATFTEGEPGNFFAVNATAKEGLQVSPHGFITGDPLFLLFLSFPTLTFSSVFSRSDDFFADGALDYGGNIFPSFSSVFEGVFVAETSGQADIDPAGAQQFVQYPDPTLAGLGFNLSGTGIGIDICANPDAIIINEVYNAMTVFCQ
jgi:hypothetical protein